MSTGGTPAATPALTLSESVHGVGVGTRQQDDELVAAEARGDVDPARLLGQHAAQPRQHAITDVVAVLIIDVLEAVEVECDDAERAAITRCARDLGADPLLQAAPVQ
jgi:hypothetical protein